MKKLVCLVMAFFLLCAGALAATDSRTGEDMSYIFGNGTGEVVQYGDVVYQVLGPDDEVFGVKVGDGRLPIVEALKNLLPNLDFSMSVDGQSLFSYEFAGLLEALGQEEMERILSLPLDGEERIHMVLVALGWYGDLTLEDEQPEAYYFSEDDARKIADGVVQYMGAERPYKVLVLVLREKDQPDTYVRMGFAFEDGNWWLCRMVYSLFPIEPTALQ